MGVSREQVLEALRAVNDPELNRDLVALGMIDDLAVSGGDVSLTINLTTPACPLASRIEQDARRAVERLPGVGRVAIRMAAVTRKSADTGDLLPEVSHVVAVGSGKGGVGKSTVSANLALALARAGARVGLMDADVYGPNLPLMLGVTAVPRSEGGRLLPVEIHGIKLISMGFFIREDEPVIWRGPMLHGVMRQFLGDVAWGALDYLIIDLPPGTGDVQLTLSQAIPLSGALVVTTPQDVALLDARKAIAMFARANVPILGIIENMSSFVCPHCGGKSEIFGSGGGSRTAERLGVPLFGSIPLDPALMRASDCGRPLVVTDAASPLSQLFLEMARQVAARASVVGFERARPLVTIRPGA